MFLIGFLLGVLSTILIIFLFLLIVNKKQKKIIDEDEITQINVDNYLIEDIIKENRWKIIKGKNKGVRNNYERIHESSIDMAEKMSKMYFPKSKFSKFELTLEESLLLNIHISERLLFQLKKKRFKVLRDLRISQILYINDAKNKVLEHKLMKKLDKYRIVDVVKNGWMIANIANPAYWVKKIAIEGGIEGSIRSFGVIIINVVGEEINAVYSKSFKRKKRD